MHYSQTPLLPALDAGDGAEVSPALTDGTASTPKAATHAADLSPRPTTSPSTAKTPHAAYAAISPT